MAVRFVAGYHAGKGQFGIWMTEPGYDVFSAPNDKMLLRPDSNYQVSQVAKTGTISLAPGGAQDITNPLPSGVPPYVMWQEVAYTTAETPDGQLWYPFRDVFTNPGGSNPYNVNVIIFPTYIRFLNLAPAIVYFHYMVFTRRLGS